MGRDTSNAAMQNSNSAQSLSKGYAGNANSAYSVLTPTLTRMATAPQGFTPQTMANMNTAATQSIGGATAGTVGQGNLQAARTNNQGAFQPVATQAAHDATGELSDAALGIQNRNAMLQEQQRSQGLSGLEGLYNTNVGAGENALGLSTQALAAKNAADELTFNQWYKPFATIAGGAAQAAAGAGK